MSTEQLYYLVFDVDVMFRFFYDFDIGGVNTALDAVDTGAPA
jgi:hypothetical protein